MVDTKTISGRRCVSGKPLPEAPQPRTPPGKHDTTQENISLHVSNVYADGELDKDRTYKKFLLVQTEGKRQVRRNIDHYNLDMIIALGYRIQSRIATRFRRWATQRLHEYIQKGFAMDDERLKQGGNRYFRELLHASETFVVVNATFTSR